MSNLLAYAREILFLFGPQRRAIPLVVFLFILSSALEVIGLGLLLPFVKVLLEPTAPIGAQLMSYVPFIKPESLLPFLGVLIVGAFVVKGILAVVIQGQIVIFAARQLAGLTSWLMRVYHRRPYETHVGKSVSDCIRTSTQTTFSFYTTISVPLLRGLAELGVLIAIVSVLAWQNWQMLALLVLVLGTTVGAYERLIRRRLQRYGREFQDQQAVLTRTLQESLVGLKEIRVLGGESAFQRITDEAARVWGASHAKQAAFSLLPRYVLEIVLVTFFIVVASIEGAKGDFAAFAPGLALFAVGGMRLIPSATTVTSSLTSLRFGRHAARLLFEELRDYESLSASPTDSSLVTRHEPFEELRLDGVTFGYATRPDQVLSDAFLTVRAGESIGIVGPSGAGKTTLVDLILGLLEPGEGAVRLNGQSLRDAGMLGAWREHVAYVPQEVFLIDDTLAENVRLRMSARGEKAHELMRALTQAQLHELVDRLPDGIETLVGDRGIQLSGGQRQRVALARALFHDRDVLVLDEATSSLDSETEREIVDEIKHLKGHKTLIVIAHRLSTVQHCDRIYRIEDGSIVERSFEEVSLGLSAEREERGDSQLRPDAAPA